VEIVEEFSLEKLILKFQNNILVIWAILWSFLNNGLDAAVDSDEEQVKSADPDLATALPYHPKEAVCTFSVSHCKGETIN